VRERVVFPLGFAFFSVLALLANKALGIEEQWPKTNFYRFSFRRRAVPGRAFASLDFPFVFADFGLAPLCKKKRQIKTGLWEHPKTTHLFIAPECGQHFRRIELDVFFVPFWIGWSVMPSIE
jgi:hypothetical protein